MLSYLLIVLRECDVFEAFQLDDKLLKRRKDSTLLLCWLGLLPIVDSATDPLHAFEQWKVVSVFAESTPDRALVASMVAVAIPANLRIKSPQTDPLPR